METPETYNLPVVCTERQERLATEIEVTMYIQSRTNAVEICAKPIKPKLIDCVYCDPSYIHYILAIDGHLR